MRSDALPPYRRRTAADERLKHLTSDAQRTSMDAIDRSLDSEFGWKSRIRRYRDNVKDKV